MTKTQRRRQREKRTDYKARLGLLKSGKLRLVVRKSNRYILVQIIDCDNAQDRVLARASSKELLEQGWPVEKRGSLKSIHAAYLTGFFLGTKLRGKIKEAIFDSGIQRNVHGSRVYSALQGAVDAGLNIPHDASAFSTEGRMKANEKLFNIMKRVKEKL